MILILVGIYPPIFQIPLYIWPTCPRWRSLQLASHLPCSMTCAQRRGRTWNGGGKQREAKPPNALRRSRAPPNAPRVWSMLPHPRPDQRQHAIAPLQAASASCRPFAKWKAQPNFLPWACLMNMLRPMQSPRQKPQKKETKPAGKANKKRKTSAPAALEEVASSSWQNST